MISIHTRLMAVALLGMVSATTGLALDSPPGLAPEDGIEVEAMVRIADGEVVGARERALAQAFGEIVTIAAETHTGIGSLAEKPAIAKRLKRGATGFLVGYQVLTDVYQLEEVVEEVAEEVVVDESADPPLELEEEGARRVIPAGHYLVRVRGWVDEALLRSALGMADDAVADLAVVFRDVSGEIGSISGERLERFRATLTDTLADAGWQVAHKPDARARRQLHVEVDGRRPRLAGDAVEEVAVKLTVRLVEPEGGVSAILQARGGSNFANLDFAWAEAEKLASADLVARLRAIFPPPRTGAEAVERGNWVDLAISPLARYEWGLELEELLRGKVAGVVRVDRIGYAGHRFRLRLLYDGPPDSLPARLEALQWRDFTLQVLDPSAGLLEVRVQRF